MWRLNMCRDNATLVISITTSRAPLAALRGERPGVRGLHGTAIHGECGGIQTAAPSSPALLPCKAEGEESQGFRVVKQPSSEGHER